MPTRGGITDSTAAHHRLPWSLDYMTSAFEACDAVIIPQLAEDTRKRAKSNNRLVDALQAGRFVVAHAIPSYTELRDYCWLASQSLPDWTGWSSTLRRRCAS